MFSALYGCGEGCCRTQGRPPNSAAVRTMAVLDIVVSAIAVGIIFAGPKFGLHLPPMGQYALGVFAAITAIIVLNKHIIPVETKFSP